LFFFSAKKNQKARRAKNSLYVWFFLLAFWFAFSLICFSCLPFAGFMASKGYTILLEQFSAT
jgi:hypothetical protein